MFRELLLTSVINLTKVSRKYEISCSGFIVVLSAVFCWTKKKVLHKQEENIVDWFCLQTITQYITAEKAKAGSWSELHRLECCSKAKNTILRNHYMKWCILSVDWTYPGLALLLTIWFYNILSHIQLDLISIYTVSMRLAMCPRAWRSCWFYSSFNHVSPLWYNQQSSTQSWFILTPHSRLNSSIWC